MSAAKVIEFDPLALRRFEIACERERLETKVITPDEMSRLIVATKGERMNYDLIGRVLAVKLRLRDGR